MFDFKDFMEYLMTKAGGSKDKMTAKSIAADLIEFFHETSQSSKQSFYNIDILLNRSNLELFVHYMKYKKEYKPTVISEKIQRLKIARDQELTPVGHPHAVGLMKSSHPL